MRNIKLILIMVFTLDIIPILLLFILKKGNFLAGSTLLLIYGFLWVIKIPISINILKRNEMTRASYLLLGIIMIIFFYIQYLNYVFVYKTT